MLAGFVKAKENPFGSVTYGSFNSWQTLCDLVEDDSAKGLTPKGLFSLDVALNNGALLRRYSKLHRLFLEKKSEL